MARQRTTAHKSNFRTIIRAIVAVVGLGIVIGVIYFIGTFFRVKTVKCTLDNEVCPEALQSSLNVLQNQSLFFVDLQKAATKNGIPVPATLTKLKKQLPHTVSVEFSSETLLYQLQTDQGMVAISSSGTVFHDIAERPPITIEVKPPLNQLITADGHLLPDMHQGLVAVVENLGKYQLPISHITWVDKDSILLIMNEGQLTGIIDSKSPNTELEKLQTILQSDQYQKVASTVKEIDVRFKLPVLRMKQ